jgi:hypothetical protein
MIKGFDIDLAISMKKDGATIKEIGKAIGTCQANARKMLTKIGEHSPAYRRASYSIDVIRDLIDKGFSRKDVAIFYGVSTDALSHSNAWRSIQSERQ